MNLRRFWRQLAYRPNPWIAPTAPQPPVLTGPPLAIVVVCYKMDRQIANTLRSLLPPYQRDVSVDQYEIHVIDNGSPAPLDESVWNISSNIRYHYVAPAEASGNPGAAINRAVLKTSSPLLCVMIDGARMVTPGVLKWGMELTAASPTAIADVRSWHLGHKSQNDSVAEGYSPEVEQELLDSIAWPTDGYRLFDIGFPSMNTRAIYYHRVFESNCLFIKREMFDEIGGYDERYKYPGGGLVGVDFFHRAVVAAGMVFTVLGEGTFHQTHGGAASGLTREKLNDNLELWREEYELLSRPWQNRHRYEQILAGHVPPPVRRWLVKVPKKKT